jgi:hypothetical protein
MISINMHNRLGNGLLFVRFDKKAKMELKSREAE